MLYLRLSDARNENGSFVEREKKLRLLAKRLGWTVVAVVVENDVDPVTGKPRSASAFKRRTVTLTDGRRVKRVVRPGFRRVLDDLAAGRADALIAEDLDRTMRDPRDAEDLIDVIREKGAFADSLSGSLKFTAGGTDAEVLQARILVAVGHKSSADTARRVKEARERQAMDGRYGGGSRAFGFELDGVTIRESEAAEIRRVADAFLAGASLNSLITDLRARKVPTVTGSRWAGSTLRTILRHPRLAGVAVYRGVEVGRGGWEPILPEHVWRAVVGKLADPSRRTSPGNTPRWLGSLIYRCGRCDDGTTLRCTISGGSGKRGPAYRCRERPHLTRTAGPLDDFVQKIITERLARPDAADLIAPAPDIDVDVVRAEASALRARIEALANNLDIDEVTLGRRDRALRAKLAEVEAAMTAAEGRHPLAGIAGRPDAAEIWAGLDLGRRRAILDTLMTVTVMRAGIGRGPDGSYFNPNSIDIEWKTS